MTRKHPAPHKPEPESAPPADVVSEAPPAPPAEPAPESAPPAEPAPAPESAPEPLTLAPEFQAPTPPEETVALRTDGPTLDEYVAAGYPADKYPPEGYAVREPEALKADDEAQPTRTSKRTAG